MRLDEDYAEVDESQPVNSSRAMSWMVLAVAVGGFAALAYYAYHSGTKSMDGADTAVIQADNSPIKEAPANPEGEQFPDKDKTIYDVIAPNGEQKTAEKLMPEPEHPIAATNVEDSEDDAPPPNAAAAQAPAPVASAPAASNNAAAPATAANTTTFVAGTNAPAMANTTSTAPQNVSEQTVATTAKPVATAPAAAATPAAKSYAAPEMVNEKKATAKKDAPAATAKTEVAAKPKAEPKKAAAKPAAGGSYMVQLGAFKSESEAQAAWKKISGAHSDVLGGTPTIVKAEVNGTTYYRLRTGSYASAADAKADCGKLGGQACMPVK